MIGQPADTPRVSVVIPTYKQPENVRQAVRSLFDQTLDHSEYEVIVVDSSPDDRVASVVNALIPEAPFTLRLLTKKPEGPGPSRNLGAAHARAEFIALMDSDCVATPDWLTGGLAAFDDGVGIVQGRTLPEPDVPTGVFTRYIVVEEENHVYECANIFYRTSAFRDVGGFDAAYDGEADVPVGGEDVELAWRVKRAGWQSRFSAEALVYHEVQPLNMRGWIYIRTLHLWPGLTKRCPELRAAFFARYFFDRHQAWILLALIALVCAWWAPYALTLTIPYAISRGMEPTRALRGPLRLIRVCVYVLRDVTSLAILTVASVRSRCLLL